MAAESLTRSSAINLINGSIDSFMFSHACYCTSNMESLSEDDLELYDQMHEVISILNDDEDYRHDLETMLLEDLKEFLLMCRKMADNNNLSLKSEFPQGNFEIVEDEKTETELNPDKIENEKSFWNTLWGALQGEYNENPTGTEILIDMGLNFIPFVGQACDVRDITACLKKLVIEKRVNEIMIWVTLLLTAIGCVPYAGDVVKAGCKAILKGADDIVLKILRKLDADDVQKAFKMLKTKFTSSIDDAIAMVNKWIKEAGNSKYGSKINEVLGCASEKLAQATDFVTSKIDEFEEKVFGKLNDNIEKSLDIELKIDKDDLTTVRTRFGVPKTETVAVGKTNVKGLEKITFEGQSPKVRKEAGLPDLDEVWRNRNIKAPGQNPLFTRHAEEVLANSFDKAVIEAKIKPEDVRGVLKIHQSNPSGVCRKCIQGLDNDIVKPGVLKQLSLKYPNLRIEVTSEVLPNVKVSGKSNFVIMNGKYIQ